MRLIEAEMISHLTFATRGIVLPSTYLLGGRRVEEEKEGGGGGFSL